ncbi:hypothetical protein [Leptospira ilyithenensis]|uniref:Uncharacterized protein n=1 Tax=Leptospira ilyithenensis TaxID=2484901 RepID=A0A4R9LPY2_9LEPT|nr:hypothetical protein [Leptospira ilyithenensis]TGN09743.1 hypothetical protein EHS11_11705 [Leptospira ilyithenensis]
MTKPYLNTMHNKRFPFFFLLSVLFSSGCTFGSIGDANAEKLTILQNLLTQINEIRTSLQSQVVLYDDQSDDSLGRFNLISNNITYSITVQSAVLKIDSGSYRINPSNRLFGSINASSSVSVKTHTPYTVPLDLPTTDPYGKSYSYIGSSVLNSFFTANAQTDTGYAYSVPNLTTITDAPVGVVSLVSMSIPEWYWDLQIIRQSDNSIIKTQIYLKPGTKMISPKCRIPVDGARKTPVPISLQYSNIFKDRIYLSQTYTFLQTLFANYPSFIGSTSSLVIAEFSATDLYKILSDNLSTEDLIFFVPGCFPNVELR